MGAAAQAGSQANDTPSDEREDQQRTEKQRQRRTGRRVFRHQRGFLPAAQALNIGQRQLLPGPGAGLRAQGGDVLQDPLRVQGFDRLAQTGRAVEQFVEMLPGDFQ